MIESLVSTFKDVANKVERTDEYHINKESLNIFNRLFKDDYGEKIPKLESNNNIAMESGIKPSYADINKIWNELFSNDKNVEHRNEKIDVDKNSDFRPLTENEKNRVMEFTGWNEETIDSKCTINDDGLIHYKCNNEHLVGQTYKDTRITYVEKIVDINGLKVEVVAPKFNSKLDVILPKDLIRESDRKQFKECNEYLYNEIQNNPKLAKIFNIEQLEQIKNGDTPEGYTWHHDMEVGKMQLVETKIHDRTQGGVPHTGGKSIWGGGAENR